MSVALGLVGGLAWVGKFLVMVAQDGPDPDSVPENVAFFLGLLALPVAAGALGWHLAHRRPVGLRVLAVVGAVLALVGLLGLLQLALGALPGDAWQQEEAAFLVLGCAAALAALGALLRRRAT